MQTAVDLLFQRYGLSLDVELCACLLRNSRRFVVLLVGVADVFVLQEVLPPNDRAPLLVLLFQPLLDDVLDAAADHVVGIRTERLACFAFVLGMAARDIVICFGLRLGDDVGAVLEVDLQPWCPSHLLLLLLLLPKGRLDAREEGLRLRTGSASHFRQVYLRDLEGVGRALVSRLIPRRLREAEWSTGAVERDRRLRWQTRFGGGRGAR